MAKLQELKPPPLKKLEYQKDAPYTSAQISPLVKAENGFAAVHMLSEKSSTPEADALVGKNNDITET